MTISLLCYFSCTNNKEKSIMGDVALVCLREKDTLFTKVTNNTHKVIYLPKQYLGGYTINDDTIHLETIEKDEYATDCYFAYKKIFPFLFYTTRQINKVKPDTVITIKGQTTYYNQFLLEPMIPLLPDSSIVMKVMFTIPDSKNVVKAVYYTEPFLDKKAIDEVNYSFGDFLRFDSIHAHYTNSMLLQRVFPDSSISPR